MTSPTHVQELESILEAIGRYTDGCAKADSSVMKPAFHPNASLRHVDAEGGLVAGSVEELLFQPVDRDFEPSPGARAVVARVDIVGNAASARVDTDDLYGFRFTDFFQLLKVQGEWTIVSKIFHTHA